MSRSVTSVPDTKTLDVLQSLAKQPVIEGNLSELPKNPEETFAHQFRAWLTWFLLLTILGWMALPLTLRILSPLQAGGFPFSKVLGTLIFAWTVWFFTSIKLAKFTTSSCWLWLLLLGSLFAYGFWRDRALIQEAYKKWGKSWWIQEAIFLAAFLAFTLVKIHISHIHDPVGDGYHGGGEAGMDYGFLASTVRGETFPPENMWMAGEPIGYSFYFGHLLMGILTKTLGLVPAVTYNLALVTLFAVIFSCAFGLAFALSGKLTSGWIAGSLCAVAGNPAGAYQILDSIRLCFVSGSFGPLTRVYDYWGPTRVIPNSINEFPYFSVLYGDMHAHILAVPFGMLFLAITISIFHSHHSNHRNWRRETLHLLVSGFVVGGIAFLNTWEVPVWLLLFGAVFPIPHITSLNSETLKKGFIWLFIAVLMTAVLLGWQNILVAGTGQASHLKTEWNRHALGGETAFLAAFGTAGFAGAMAGLYWRRKTRPLFAVLLKTVFGLMAIFVTALVFWLPYLYSFSPQQSTVMWVIPSIRTTMSDYLSIHGFFLSVLALSFTTAYSRQIIDWIGIQSPNKIRRWNSIVNNARGWMGRLLSPEGAVHGALLLGLLSLMVIWGASWVHWTEPWNMRLWVHLAATITACLLAVAVWRVPKSRFTIAFVVTVLIWMVWITNSSIPFVKKTSVTLELEFFSLLWLCAFFHLGLAIKVFRKEPALSYAFLLVTFFFFLTATLEIFVMSEYYGFGKNMRNNSMFKYGIIAWVFASIATGVFVPKILVFFHQLLRSSKQESSSNRVLLILLSGILLYVLFRVVLGTFFPLLRYIHFGGMRVPFLYLFNVVAVVGFLTRAKGWAGRKRMKILALVGPLLIASSLLPILPLFEVGTGLAFLQHLCDRFSVYVVFPAMIVGLVLGLTFRLQEKKKDFARRTVFQSWKALCLALLVMISVYPLFSSWRKSHGFFDRFRDPWVRYVERRTLNGLEFIARVNPADAAAIHFLNRNVPGQPYLVEFVGEGYGSWGSRFSIFTGIPALMGWHQHVSEWAGATKAEDIRTRFLATEQIYRSLDPAVAKKYLDIYGVRLVIVGTLERQGVPGGKPGYPANGLAKFEGFLPLIYRNPDVSIYYNPPSE